MRPNPRRPGGRGLPLRLPESLPDGVYVVATSRFGIDRALHAVRNPADWLEIEVEGAGNLDDMRRFLQDVTSPEGGDARLVTMLRRRRRGHRLVPRERGAGLCWGMDLLAVCAG